MINFHILERPAFEITGKKTWISGQDNSIFGKFWEDCRAEGLFKTFETLTGFQPGAQTRGMTLGVSCVEADPTQRSFYYFIAVEKPAQGDTAGLECHQVPAATWAVFECHGKVPEALVESEIFAFAEWLPSSGYVHANAPEMEVYPSEEDDYLEFWLPITRPRGRLAL
jgi:AraC family transcriptional regulator